MNVLCCPDSLKGVLSAHRAAAALAAGCRRVGATAEELPLADGGEGTADALYRALGGKWETAEVSDPLGRPVVARYLVLHDGRAVIESAEAIGLSRLEAGERDPMRASSLGVGQLILAAAESAPGGLIVALGGSATVDGGAGLREVLAELPAPVKVACDVRNPLLGDRGAARVFGPQKGATPDQVVQLEERLAGMEELAPFARLPGAGAAGGLGAALAAMGAELVPGIDVVLEAVDFRARISKSSLALTGEGAVDESSLEGKVPAGVAAACGQAEVPCVVFGGRVEAGIPEQLYEMGATAVFPLSGMQERTRSDLEAFAEAAVRLACSLEGR